ncbi:hypothetical protein GM421_02120 [Lactobacillus delbrueckii]|nr:hypothetical protein GM421_02120 [Lactobacillus delbrueckii]
MTTPSSQALANATKKKPIVLGAVTDPKGAGLMISNGLVGLCGAVVVQSNM